MKHGRESGPLEFATVLCCNTDWSSILYKCCMLVFLEWSLLLM